MKIHVICKILSITFDFKESILLTLIKELV
jgi:hypothetical protein